MRIANQMDDEITLPLMSKLIDSTGDERRKQSTNIVTSTCKHTASRIIPRQRSYPDEPWAISFNLYIIST